MHTKHKNLKRTAILSALSVAAITGISVVDAFAATDNMSLDTNTGQYTLQEGSNTGNLLGGVDAHQLKIVAGQAVGVVGNNTLTGPLTGTKQSSLQMDGATLYVGSKFGSGTESSPANFERVGGATLTADNVSMTDGSLLELYQSTLDVNKAMIVDDSAIHMYSSTITVAEGTGTLTLNDSTLTAQSGTSTIKASVDTVSSTVNVSDAASLNITGALTLNDSHINVGTGSALTVGGGIDLAAGDTTSKIMLQGGSITTLATDVVDTLSTTNTNNVFEGSAINTGVGALLTATENKGTVYADLGTKTFGLDAFAAFNTLVSTANADLSGGIAGSGLKTSSAAPLDLGVAGNINYAYTGTGGLYVSVAPTGTNADISGSQLSSASGLNITSTGATSLEVSTGTVVGSLSLNGSTTISSLEVTGDFTLAPDARDAQVIEELTGGGSLYLGNSVNAATVLLEDISGFTGVLGTDPDWFNATGAPNPNTYAQITGGVAGGGAADVQTGADLVAGQNSILTIDNGRTLAQGQAYWEGVETALGGLSQTGYTAAVAFADTLDLNGTGSLLVNGAWTNGGTVAPAAAGIVDFANNSLIMVDADNFARNGIIIDGADELVIAQAVAGTTQTAPTVAFDNVFLGANSTDSLIFVNNVTIDNIGVGGFANAETAVDSMTIHNLQYGLRTTLSTSATGTVAGNVIATTGVDEAFDDATDLLADYYALANQPAINAAAGEIGASFVASILDPLNYTSRGYSYEAGRQQAASDLNSALRAATLSGPIASLMSVGAGVSALEARNSIVGGEGVAMVTLAESSDQWTGMSAGSAMGNGVGLWITPLYKAANSWSMDAGDHFKTGYNASLGGVAIGGDITFENAFRIGLTFNVGAGYASSNGDLADTNNDFDFWGLGFYAGYYHENFGLTADFGYTSTYNSINQDALVGAAGFGGIETDTMAGAFTVGLRGEYKISLDALDITPHVGVRYMGIQTYGYDIDVNGGTAFEGDGFHQSVWTFPIGVTFSNAIETGDGWTVTPSLDLTIIPAAGDFDVETDVNIAGLANIGSSVTTQVLDGFSYQSTVGVDFGNENLTFGLDYTLTGSQRTTNHGLQATFRYEF